MIEEASKRRKTKVIATIGPATKSLEKIKELIQAGANIFRLNFSHGSHDDHLETLKSIRQAEEELGQPIGILQDLSGPKIRITELAQGKEDVLNNTQVNLSYGPDKISDNKDIYTQTVDPAKILKPGNAILLADGLLQLKAEKIEKGIVTCKVIKGGKLRSRVGIAFPDSEIDLPATTDKDLVDFEWGIKNSVDYIAVSFVQKAADIERLKNKINDEKDAPLLISKIEMKTALKNIDEIFQISDGIMVARGDLGVELPVEKLPSIQKKLIAKANSLGIPVIVATQMLHSMVHSNRPTRAEVTDVATAVTSGADAVMLSEETAIGEYPVESVEYLDRIAKETEKDFNFELYRVRFESLADEMSVPDAIAYAACAASHRLDAAAIAACTETGYSAKLVAKYRPQQPLFGISSRKRTIRRMCLYWGVLPLTFDAPDSRGTEIETALKTIKEIENLPNGSIAVTTGGLNVRVPGATSVLDIRKIE